MSAPLRIVINEQLSLELAMGSDMARLAQLSQHEVLRSVEEAVLAKRRRTSPFADWCERFLDRSNPHSTTDADSLFVSYYQFADAAGVAADDRLTHAAFGRAMSRIGHTSDRTPTGRLIRCGCKLRAKTLVMVDPAPGIDRFLVERCETGMNASQSKVRSTTFHQAYILWAIESGAPILSLKRLAEAMKYRGFDKRHSNGMWWFGVELAPAHSETSSATPHPEGEFDAPSMPECDNSKPLLSGHVRDSDCA